MCLILICAHQSHTSTELTNLQRTEQSLNMLLQRERPEIMLKEGYDYRKPHGPSGWHYLNPTLKIAFFIFCS